MCFVVGTASYGNFRPCLVTFDEDSARSYAASINDINPEEVNPYHCNAIKFIPCVDNPQMYDVNTLLNIAINTTKQNYQEAISTMQTSFMQSASQSNQEEMDESSS